MTKYRIMVEVDLFANSHKDAETLTDTLLRADVNVTDVVIGDAAELDEEDPTTDGEAWSGGHASNH